MNNRERIIRLWFEMWLAKKDLGISDIFSSSAIYIESWGPEYHGVQKIALWFEEWNTRGTVLQWDIKQFFHKDNQTIVEWYFKNQMNGGKAEAFDGISLIEWTSDDKIARAPPSMRTPTAPSGRPTSRSTCAPSIPAMTIRKCWRPLSPAAWQKRSRFPQRTMRYPTSAQSSMWWATGWSISSIVMWSSMCACSGTVTPPSPNGWS